MKKQVFLLLASFDDAMTRHSFGVAVSNEDEARRFLAESDFGVYRMYEVIDVHETWQEATRKKRVRVFRE